LFFLDNHPRKNIGVLKPIGNTRRTAARIVSNLVKICYDDENRQVHGDFPENSSTVQQDGQNRSLTFPAAVLVPATLRWNTGVV